MTKYAPRILERPSTVKEAVSLLKEWGSSARLVAGNTTIYELAREGALGDVQCLIDVMQLGLNYIRSDYSRLQIAATTTFLEMATSPILSQSDFYVLKETAGKI